MADETRTEEVVNNDVVTEEKEISADNQLTSTLMDAFLNDTTVTHEAPKTEQKEEIKEPPKSKTEETEEIFDEADYLKNKFGWDSEEVAQNELKTLREKATQTPQTFEFKNEDSKRIAEYINEGKIDDLYSFLDTQKKIDKLSKSDLTDKNIAAELVKFGIQKDNPNLSQDDVDFLFDEKYSLPAKPVQDLEDDQEFAQKLQAWQQQVNNIEKRMIIEAKMAQPKLAQLKTELVLPEIKRENAQPITQQPSQEEVAKFEAAKNSFLQAAQQTVTSFDGFKVQVKDKDVDYTVSYTPSPEEKSLVESKMQQFAQSGFDANVLFYDRWLNEDGSINQNKIVEDYMNVITKEKAQQKIANDSAGKRLEAFIKEKKKIVVGKEPQGTFRAPAPETQTEALTNAFLNV